MRERTPGICEPVAVKLPRAALALARARRMLDDLSRHQTSEVDLTDRLPYVLDLLAGVTPTIDQESKGSRTTHFADWWSTVEIQLRREIADLRNAELKRLESRSQISNRTATAVRAADYPELALNNGDSITWVMWAFVGGPLEGQPVMKTLNAYIDNLHLTLAEAETNLDSPTN